MRRRRPVTGPITTDGYPTSDGKPMAETDHHRLLMTALIESLTDHFAADDDTYVSGNLLLFYEEGNRRRHVSPDVMVVFGVPKHPRLHYKTWVEGKGPDAVIELTSATTKREDRTKKWTLYRDVMKVPEYFLFDPFGDYLNPRFQGFRLVRGEYKEMKFAGGRLRSRKLGLELEAVEDDLRLFDPKTGAFVPTRGERVEAAKEIADEEKRRANAERNARLRAEAENDRLRSELDELKRKLAGG
jgi:Uma2 family endonuclease